LPHYVGRAEAVALYAEGDPGVGVDHVFQGDIFHSLELYTPTARVTEDQFPLSAAIVVSHHCEWTKARKKIEEGNDWPVLLAPLHELERDFDRNEQGLIRDNRFRYYLYLPANEPTMDREHAVDLRLIQPFSALSLSRSAQYYWCGLGEDLLAGLRAKVVEFIWREFTA
jgi:hypothetical protein